MAEVSRGIILAAGVGARLKWLTQKRPKALVRIGTEPAIVHVIRRLAAQGIHDIAVNLYHHARQIPARLGDGSRYGVRLTYSREAALLDTGGGVKRALSLLSGDGLVLVHNADVLANVDIGMLARRCPQQGACLALVHNPAHHPQGDFSLCRGMVIRGEDERAWTYAGVSVWDGSIFEDWPATSFPLLDPMRALMARGRLAGVRHEGLWLDVGRPRDLLRARRIWVHA